MIGSAFVPVLATMELVGLGLRLDLGHNGLTDLGHCLGVGLLTDPWVW